MILKTSFSASRFVSFSFSMVDFSSSYSRTNLASFSVASFSLASYRPRSPEREAISFSASLIKAESTEERCLAMNPRKAPMISLQSFFTSVMASIPSITCTTSSTSFKRTMRSSSSFILACSFSIDRLLARSSPSNRPNSRVIVSFSLRQILSFSSREMSLSLFVSLFLESVRIFLACSNRRSSSASSFFGPAIPSEVFCFSVFM